MKKKIGVFSLILTLLVLMISCGNNESAPSNPASSNPTSTSSSVQSSDGTTDDEQDSSQLKVTQQEWVKAFTLDGVESFTLSHTQIYTSQNQITSETNCMYSYSNGMYKLVREISGKPTTVICLGDKPDNVGEIKKVGDIFEALIETLEESENFGFGLATYNNSISAYTVGTNIGKQAMPITANVYFSESKLIEKIEFDFSKDENGILSGTFNFGDYNSAEPIAFPDEAMQDVISGAGVIGTASSVASDNLSINDSEYSVLLGELQTIFGALNAGDICEYSFTEGDGTSSSVAFMLDELIINTIGGNDVAYDYIEISLSNGRITSVHFKNDRHSVSIDFAQSHCTYFSIELTY